MKNFVTMLLYCVLPSSVLSVLVILTTFLWVEKLPPTRTEVLENIPVKLETVQEKKTTEKVEGTKIIREEESITLQRYRAREKLTVVNGGEIGVLHLHIPGSGYQAEFVLRIPEKDAFPNEGITTPSIKSTASLNTAGNGTASPAEFTIGPSGRDICIEYGAAVTEGSVVTVVVSWTVLAKK